MKYNSKLSNSKERSILMQFQDKVVLITGATNDIGYQTAKQFAYEGARLALVDNYHNINAMELSSEDGFISDRSLLISVDGGTESEIAVVVDDVVQYFGKIDVFIHAASGDCPVGQITEIEEDELEQVFNKIKHVFFLLKHVLPVMQKNGSGSIVTYGTVSALMGLPMLSSYVMLNHALVGLVKTAAMENSQSNIRLNAVCSAPIESQIMSKLESRLSPGMEQQVKADFCRFIPMRRYGTPEEVTNLILFLASEQASYITGSIYTIDGGLSAAR